MTKDNQVALGNTAPGNTDKELHAQRIGIVVKCIVCLRMKKPIGRSASPCEANSYCDDECTGYRAEPYPGSLWPGESEVDFGYPVGADGTRAVDGGQIKSSETVVPSKRLEI